MTGRQVACQPVNNLFIAECTSCNKCSVWRCDQEIYPLSPTKLPPQDLPDECRADFSEAVAIMYLSPRAARALLRACIEKLLKKLTGVDNPNDAIRMLSARGQISGRVQQAMDVIRVTGNKALHGYQISADEEGAADAGSLIELLELIVDQCIAVPRREQALFDALPAVERDKIEKRNAASRGSN